MAASSRRRAAGFTLPLTMALAFSLMTLATAVVSYVVVGDKQAKQTATDVVTRAALESAIEQSLFGLERDGEPQAAQWTDNQSFNGLDIRVTFWPAHYRPDLNQSSASEVDAVLADPGLRQRVDAAFAPIDATQHRRQFSRFIEFVRAAGADPADEDCLRHRLTIGRRSGVTDPAPPVTALIPQRAALQAGELIDIRAETFDGQRRHEALWRRVRFTGKPDQLWLTHDWRELRLPRTLDCPEPAQVTTITPDLNLGGNSAAAP